MTFNIRAAASLVSPVDTADAADDPSKPKCVYCAAGFCDECIWADRPNSCTCACGWLRADVARAFPTSLGDQ